MTATKGIYECGNCDHQYEKWYEYEPAPWDTAECPKCKVYNKIQSGVHVAITVSTKR